jgi:hypothetical protein
LGLFIQTLSIPKDSKNRGKQTTMANNKDQLALIGRVSQMKDIRAYEESKERVRIIKEDNTMSGKIVRIVQDMDYEVENINGYSDRERKDAGYIEDYVHSIEIVAKPEE